ncbi:DUF1254 domain-containing protein [Maricurvus nonylphenolicus]|uniref:DUF1254 domain-containing protein n=1 Tax=Maricurvus nonylphenolicus TaxID=1008307 RepID=UPI0036F40F27
MKKFVLLAAAAGALGLLGQHTVSTLKTTAEAYVYGYPLVIMEATRKATATTANILSHNRTFPDHNFRAVVRPNNDTLYSTSWIDLTQEPQVLSVPDTGDRYYVMPFMDAWTNVFASVGTRTTGNQAGEYALVGPDWHGQLPEGLTPINAPTNMVWLIGRTQTNGHDDINVVAELQQQFRLTGLTQWQAGTETATANNSELTLNNDEIAPVDQVEAMDAQTFFTALNQIMGEQAPAKADQPLLDRVASLGIGPNAKLTDSTFTLMLMNKAIELARDKFAATIASKSDSQTSWELIREGIGNYGTDYKTRAFVAKIGLGALPPGEAMYPNTDNDSKGQALHGQHNYRIHFAAGQTPPVDAFWSITLYDEQGFMTNNPIQRYAIGDRNQLTYNDDGSLDIYVQRGQPVSGQENWLPSPEAPFSLTMRIYLPQQAVLAGDWNLPAIQKIN